MFPFFAPVQNQSQTHGDLSNQQFRPPMQNTVFPQPVHVGFNPQNTNLMAMNLPLMSWPCPMNGTAANVPIGMQLGLLQQQQQQQQQQQHPFQNFNAVMPSQFMQGFNQISRVQHQVNSNLQGVCQQNEGSGANQMVFNQIPSVQQQVNGNLQNAGPGSNPIVVDQFHCMQQKGNDNMRSIGTGTNQIVFNQIPSVQQQVKGNLQAQVGSLGANKMALNQIPGMHHPVKANLQGTVPHNTVCGANQTGFSQIPIVQQQHVKGQGIYLQNGGPVSNQVVGLQQGQLYNPNALLPVNGAVMQQCLQSLLAGNQLVTMGNAAVNMPKIASSLGSNALVLPPGNVNLNHRGQQQAVGPMTNCWNPQPEMLVASGAVWPSVVPTLQQALEAQNSLLSGEFSAAQESQNKMMGNAISHVNFSNSTSPNFKSNPNGCLKRGQSQGRFLKPHSFNTSIRNGNIGKFARNGGAYNERQRNPQNAKFNRDPQSVPRRSLSVIYTEQEILRWREARKRNYPSKARIEKKLKGLADTEAESRRQQLKEILAKQAELGVEVAELPPNYLSESENPTHGQDDHRKFRDRRGRFQNKFNKRGRRGPNNRHSKRQRPAINLAPVKRSPTLLQKLLSVDIKRDKIYLLQVFRFMTLNRFFDHWPEKQLVFPNVTAKDCMNGFTDDMPAAAADGVADEVKADPVADAQGGDHLAVEEAESDCESTSNSSSSGRDDEDVAGCDNFEKSEEGEITE